MQNYEITQMLGAGSYGKVYRARNRKTNEIVAIKELTDLNFSAGIPLEIVREACALQTVKHRHIVKVKDIVLPSMVINEDGIKAYEDAVNPFFVFELCDCTLKDRIAEKKPFPTFTTLSWMTQITQALAYMHARQMIHRDLKPDNILLLNNEIKIADLGFARRKSAFMTPACVTLWYRAPEIILGTRSYSFSVDMWSAGCIFLELECLEPAFGALAEIELLFRVFYVLGTPTEETWPGVTDMPFWLDQFPKFDYQGFMTEFDVASDMLRLRPSQRVTAAVALERLQAQCNELCVTPTTGSKRKAMSPL